MMRVCHARNAVVRRLERRAGTAGFRGSSGQQQGHVNQHTHCHRPDTCPAPTSDGADGGKVALQLPQRVNFVRIRVGTNGRPKTQSVQLQILGLQQL